MGEFEESYPDRKGKEKYLEKAKTRFEELVEYGEDQDIIVDGLKAYSFAMKKAGALPKTATAFLDGKLYLEYQAQP